jgi:hypothetical protein
VPSILTDQVTATPDSGIHSAEIDAIFSADGKLATAVANFRPRQSQTDMARAIAQASGVRYWFWQLFQFTQWRCCSRNGSTRARTGAAVITT